MHAHKVSIIVPVYNCEDTIEKCLLSLINQTYQNKEIIVVDDSSIDRTPEILQRIAEKYGIEVIRLPVNSGEGVARSEGIKYASGDIIFEAEADAYYASDYIELCVKHLKDPKVGTVIGALHAWPENTIWYKWWEAKRRIILHNYKPLGGWFFRKSDLEKIGHYRGDLKVGTDRELCLRLKKKLDLKWAYEPKALWYHKYPYSLKAILCKAFRNGLNVVKFNKILGIHKKMFARSIAYVILVAFFLASIALAIIRKDTLFTLYPILLTSLAFTYPIYQLSSRGISIKEFKEYVLLFPLVQGFETLLLSIGYIIGALRALRE
jgi:glycosyltransferase involved in cell wall biosynthesis